MSTEAPTGPAGTVKSHFFFLSGASGLLATVNGPKLTGDSSPPPGGGITAWSNSTWSATAFSGGMLGLLKVKQPKLAYAFRFSAVDTFALLLRESAISSGRKVREVDLSCVLMKIYWSPRDFAG